MDVEDDVLEIILRRFFKMTASRLLSKPCFGPISAVYLPEVFVHETRSQLSQLSQFFPGSGYLMSEPSSRESVAR